MSAIPLEMFRWFIVISHLALSGLLVALSAIGIYCQSMEFETPKEQFLFAGRIHYFGFAVVLLVVSALLTAHLGPRQLRFSEPAYTRVFRCSCCILVAVWLIAVGLNVPSDIGDDDAQRRHHSLLIFPMIFAAHLGWACGQFVAIRKPAVPPAFSPTDASPPEPD